jgi:anti-anti-sigma regulatory factor
MSERTISRDSDGQRTIYRLSGHFDRGSAWALRDQVERDPATEVLLDFSLVREFSDLAVAVLAHGVTATTRRVQFRGLRQHQLRIFRYCGVAVEDTIGHEPLAQGLAGGAPEHQAL